MKKEERREAIEYLKKYRELDKQLYQIAPFTSVAHNALVKCLRYWDIAIQALQEPKTGRWIPVGERPPEENKTVIASTKYGVYPEARYTKEGGWEWAYESGADYWEELAGVTAWMPLPKRYEPQESEE